MKVCVHCGETKSLDAFNRSLKAKDGRQAWCRACKIAWHHGGVAKAYFNKLRADPAYRAHKSRITVAWQRRNPLAMRLKGHQRRAQAGDGVVTQADIARIHEMQGGRCRYCMELLTRYDIDHMTPLARGGQHVPANIALACRTCNARKSRMTSEEFMEATR